MRIYDAAQKTENAFIGLSLSAIPCLRHLEFYKIIDRSISCHKLVYYDTLVLALAKYVELGVQNQVSSKFNPGLKGFKLDDPLSRMGADYIFRPDNDSYTSNINHHQGVLSISHTISLCGTLLTTLCR